MSAEREEVFLGQRHLVDFSYTDVVGNETDRLVDVVDGWRACGHGYFFGWCRGVYDWRTFRDDRVRAWRVRGDIRVQDGSLLDELKRRTELRMPQLGDPPPRAAARGVVQFEPPSALASTVDELVAMVGVMVFTARVDGRVAPTEAETVRRFVFAWGRNLASAADLKGVASSRVSRVEYLQSLRLLSRSPREVRESVLAGAVAVADASVGIREDEAAVLMEIAAMFGLPWNASLLRG